MDGKVLGLDGVRAELVIVEAPDGSGKLELTKYHAPTDEQGPSEWQVFASALAEYGYSADDVA